ncbi:MAG: hypothetical protein H0T46_35865 [Deltaproteobacteria bacterium]|nr:hypothetical protein [Deltaproteobacteria bacterium]
MPLADEQLRAALQAIHARPTEPEAMAVIDVARLAASIDKVSSVAETSLLLAVHRVVTGMAGLDEMSLSSATIDENRLLSISDSLVPMAARELAYACGYLVMLGDQKITHEEGRLATMLGDVLVLEPGRTTALAKQMDELAKAAAR